MGFVGAPWSTRSRDGARISFTLVIAAILVTLSNGSPCLIDAVEWETEGVTTHMNFTDYQARIERYIGAQAKCSLFQRFAEATRRRRRSLKFRQSADPLMGRTGTDHADAGNLVLWTNALPGVGLSFLAGLSTTIGAGIVLLLPGKQASDTQMSFVLALAAGVMLSATVLEFWIPALASTSLSTGASVLFFSALGSISFLLLSKCVSEPDFTEADVETQAGTKSEVAGQPWHLAKLLLLSLTVHNFPEGFAVAASSLGNDGVGFTVALAIAMHNIPEGIAIAVPVFAATGSRIKALGWTFASGMAEPAGALLAIFIVNVLGIMAHIDIAHLLCVVGGVMFAVAVFELLPGAWNYGKPLPFATGLISGVLLMLVTIVLGA